MIFENCLKIIIAPYIFLCRLFDALIDATVYICRDIIFNTVCNILEFTLNMVLKLLLCAISAALCYLILWIMGIIIYLIVDKNNINEDDLVLQPIIYGLIVLSALIICLVSCVPINIRASHANN